MYFLADMRCHQSDDPFTVGSCQRAQMGAASGQAIQPKHAIGVEHHLDHVRVVQGGSDERAHRRAQHARATIQGRCGSAQHWGGGDSHGCSPET